MSNQNSWKDRAKGNSIGTRLFIRVIKSVGVVPAYVVLFFAALQYTLIDRKTKEIIREFRAVMGKSSNCFHLFCHFYLFGMSLIDRYAFLMIQRPFFKFTTTNEDLIEKELKKGKGVILLGAHFGNWELAGNLLKDRLDTTVNFLMFDAESEKVKEALQKVNNKRKVNIIFVGKNQTDTSILLVNALRRGEIVCLHGDRVLDDQRHEEISFLGRNAKFPAGPFILGAMTGAPIIPIFAVKTRILHYAFTAFDPIYLESVPRADREAKIRNAMYGYVTVLESMVKKYHYQWFNFYHFWDK